MAPGQQSAIENVLLKRPNPNEDDAGILYIPTVVHVARMGDGPMKLVEGQSAIYFAQVEAGEIVPFAGPHHYLFWPYQFLVVAKKAEMRDALMGWLRTMFLLNSEEGQARMAIMQRVGVVGVQSPDTGSRSLDHTTNLIGHDFEGEVTLIFEYRETAPVADPRPN